ncbi:hypothetical protein MKX08_008664 [Trichoderma sp. CBMAI-0020]|nr:hypothetical protein MKX08_008664 [Trichoderma sp. CBMAI-0020]
MAVPGFVKQASQFCLPQSPLFPPSHLFDVEIYDTRHIKTPPTFLASASLTSNTPLDVETNIHSPTPKPCTIPPLTFVGNPLVSLASSCTSTVISRDGLLITEALLSTGRPSQYLRPSQMRICATVAFVTGSGTWATICSAVGGWAPAR